MKKILQLAQFKPILFLISCLLICRLGLTMVVFYWDIPQTDDFCFMARMREYGVWGSIKWWYMHWQGRYMPQILTNFVLIQYMKFDNMLLYGLLLTLLFVFSLYQTTQRILVKTGFQVLNFEKRTLSIFSVLIFFLILDFHNDTSTLYWINVSTMYFVGTAFFILGISELLNDKKNITSYITLCFSFVYVGCSSEHFGILVLGFLLIFYLIQQYLPALGIEYFDKKKLNWAILSSFISFLIMYLAPGNDERMASIDHPSFEEGLSNISTFSKVLYFNRLSTNEGYLIFAFFFSFMIGSHFTGKILSSQKQLQQLLVVCFASLIYFVIGSVLIFGFLTTYKAPSRAFVHISTFIVLFFCLFGFIVGLQSQPKQLTFTNPLLLFLVLIYGSTILYKFNFNLKPTINYAKSVRDRLTDVQKNKSETSGYMTLPRLSNSDKNLLWKGELATNKNDTTLFWANKCLNTAYGFDKTHMIIVDSTTQTINSPK
jgi:hypothetical protein